MFFLSRWRKDNKDFYKFFKNVLGFVPRRTQIYQMALIHKSKSQETFKGHKINNERLEYLGDAVLSTVVAEYLYRKYPYQGEGFLTVMRSKIVSRANLNKLGQKIGLSQLVRYNREVNGMFKSVDGDAFEALIGAIYLEKGFGFTRKVIISKILCTYLDIDAIAHTEWNFKSKLIDWGQKSHKKVSFEVVRVLPGPRRQYESRVVIDGNPHESAIEYSIKAAEQLAAEKTYKKLREDGLVAMPSADAFC